jgi:hypothetical protein
MVVVSKEYYVDLKKCIGVHKDGSTSILFLYENTKQLIYFNTTEDRNFILREIITGLRNDWDEVDVDYELEQKGKNVPNTL